MIKLFISIALLYFTPIVNAYFYVPNYMATLPFTGGMATAQRNNNTLYMFGGENATNTYTNNLYQLTQTADTFNWQILQQNNAPPGNIYGQAVVTDNNSKMYLLGGMTNSTNNQVLPLQYYQYTFDTNTWKAASTNTVSNTTNSTALPSNRKLFSATYDNSNKIYIYGGALNETAISSDFYSMDITTGAFTSLPNPNVPRYAHTASLLSNGQLVIIGGVAQVNINGTMSNILAPMSQIYIYDTIANEWNLKIVNGSVPNVLPSTRTAHTAVVSSDDKIIIFGGDNGAGQRQRAYLNAVGILDTKTWQWSVPTVSGIPPSRRSYASGGLLNGTYLTVAFGSALNAYYNDINVLDLSTGAWLQSFEPATSVSGLSRGAIAGIAIACVAIVAIVLLLLWKFQGYVRWLFRRIHNDIWKPRSGEPVWAETTRIISQIFFLFIFAVFLAFVIRQAIESPNVTQTIEEPTSDVQVPDVRFCFDGYPTYPAADPRSTGVTCQTDIGYSCNSFIEPLDMSVFQPVFADNLGAVNCYMFRAPTDFVLTSTSGANNGSRLIFTFYADQSVTYGRVHTSVYPKEMDPNALVYGFNDSIPTLMSESNVLNWQVNERNDIEATNVYTIEPFTYSALAYDLVDHQYLQDVGWNYVGFLPISNSTPEVDTYFRQEAPNPNYASTHADIGLIAIFPNSYMEIIEREVKMYTLVNALGFVGGIFGLLVAAQAWLFGFRPRSPWGVVQRWSVGDMRQSLLRGLRSQFKITESGIPLVHPVHHRFSMTDLNNTEFESEPQRINRVEERMQMLEMLFKAYYVDDEVFRSLDHANKSNTLSNGANEGHLMSHINMNDSGRFPPLGFAESLDPRSEKLGNTDYSNTTNKSDLGYPHSFSRHDTDQSSGSQIPLTQTNRDAPPYQPSTNAQIDSP